MKSALVFYLIVLTITIQNSQEDSFPKLIGPYLGQKPPAINSLSTHWQISVDRAGPEINNPDSRQYSPYIAPDGSYMVFTRVEKTEPPVIPVVTFNISYRDKEGEWTKPIVSDDILQIKESQWGSQATVSPDGKFMFFLKDNGIEIYWVDASFIEELRPKK